jgi:hypothetical protein
MIREEKVVVGEVVDKEVDEVMGGMATEGKRGMTSMDKGGDKFAHVCR